MNINLTQYGHLILLFIAGWVSTVTYFSNQLAHRKSKYPKALSVIGFVVSFIPPVALIYLLTLYLLKDIPRNSEVGASSNA